MIYLATLVIIFWQFTVFQCKFGFFTSIQKLILSITDFELPYELPNDLKRRILGNTKYWENLRPGRGHGLECPVSPQEITF